MSDAAPGAAPIVAPASVVATVKLIHVFGGIYIWEFVTSLDFELEVYMGKRPWRWSLLVYILARLLALGAIIDAFVGFDTTTEIACNAWYRSLLVFSFAAILLSSLMILLRGVAVWGRSRYVVALTSVVWLGNVGCAIWTMQQGSSSWFAPLGACNVVNAYRLRVGILVDLLSDVVLLSVMLAGVMNKRNGTGLWRVLYIQGLSWFLIAVCSKVPPIVLGFLNLDDGWNLMFDTPHLVTIVIVATRVYRELFVYITPATTKPARLPRPPQFHNAEAAMQITVQKTVEFDVELMHQGSRPEFDGGNISEQVVSRGEQEAKQMYFAL